MLYLSGDPEAGDLFYRRGRAGSNADSGDWTEAVRVNSTPGSAVAVGTVRGGHLAVGAGRVHMAWMSADREAPGMIYTRSDGAGGFESQRNITRSESSLDGGGSVAADDMGNVYVAWHAGHDDSGAWSSPGPRERGGTAAVTWRGRYMASTVPLSSPADWRRAWKRGAAPPSSRTRRAASSSSVRVSSIATSTSPARGSFSPCMPGYRQYCDRVSTCRR